MVTAPPIFDAPPLGTRPRGSKGAYLKEETKRSIFALYSSLIRVIGAEQSASKGRRKFSRKRAKMSAGADILPCADILACFGQVVPVQAAVPVRQAWRPYKLGRSVNRSHLRTRRWRDNTFRTRSSAGLRRRAEWRVCRAQIVRSLDADLNCRPPTFQLLPYLMIYIIRRGHVC